MRFRSSESLNPRFELTPLLDVIFLLLTFFILSQNLLVRATYIDVTMPQLKTGQPVRENIALSIVVDRQGRIFWNDKPIDLDLLRRRAVRLVAQNPQPRVYLTTDQRDSRTDRLPIFLDVWQTLREAGLKEVTFVGAPAKSPSPTPPAPTTPPAPPSQ